MRRYPLASALVAALLTFAGLVAVVQGQARAAQSAPAACYLRAVQDGVEGWIRATAQQCAAFQSWPPEGTPTPQPTVTPTRVATATGVPPTWTPIPSAPPAPSPKPSPSPTPTVQPSPSPAPPPSPSAPPSPSPTGTIVSPGQSINAAIAAAPAGATIRIKAGTYREQVSVTKTLSLVAYGDGPPIIDGDCARANGLTLTAASITLRGLTVQNTREAAVLLNGRDNPNGVGDTTIDGLTIQDFDCAAAAGTINTNAGVASWYGGPRTTITNSTIRFRTNLAGGPRGLADLVWFKSTDELPSGGGHTLTHNTLIGGWDGFGGEANFDAHGGYDRDTTIAFNTITDCDDDGVEADGGTQNVRVTDNVITGCAEGISFNANVIGPAYAERNRIGSSTPGSYGSLGCFKVGHDGHGALHLIDNYCDVSAPGGVGVDQTNFAATMGPIISHGNVWKTGTYIFQVYAPKDPGTAMDNDCMANGDVTRFIKWEGSLRYTSLQAFQQATSLELHATLGCP